MDVRVREAIIFPEMLEAGLEAFEECKRTDLPSHSIVLAVYLAMQAVYEIRVMAANGTLH
jgi:hypothetical protein